MKTCARKYKHTRELNIQQAKHSCRKIVQQTLLLLLLLLLLYEEGIDCLTSGCYVLAKSEYVVLDDKISTRLHSSVCD
jgi:hypothetical protein